MSSIFAVRKQLTFYGAYHSNPINVLIHITCVPLILWTSYVMGASLPVPPFFPSVHHEVTRYLAFDVNWPAVFAFAYIAYYYALEPFAAFLYTPQIVLFLLTATSFSYQVEAFKTALAIHVFCWICQFVGHGVFEKRSPALLDNLIGAIVLAPFFVHLEVLFYLGYNPQLSKGIQNDVGVEIARIKKLEGDKRRAQTKKAT